MKYVAVFILFTFFVTVDCSVANSLIVNGDFSKGTDGWSLQADNPDGKFLLDADGIRLSRSLDGYFMRVYQDVVIEAGADYELTFELKTAGKGVGQAFVIPCSANGKWFESRTQMGPRQNAGDWDVMKMTIQTCSESTKLRINFGIQGKNSQVWVRNIELKKIAEARPVVVVPSLTSEAPPMDGRLDHPFWKKAIKLDDFRVLGTPEISAAPQTEILLAIHGDDLYIGARAEEPNMDRLIIRPKETEFGVWADDCVEMFMACEGRGKAHAHFSVNPKGEREVSLVGDPVQQNLSQWYAPAKSFPTEAWEVAGHKGDKFWSITMRVSLPIFFQNAPDAKARLFANFCRHRPQQAPVNSNWAALTGKLFSDTQQFREIRLDWKVKTIPVVAPSLNRFTHRVDLPEQMFAGKPVYLKSTSDSFDLPKEITLETSDGVVIDADLFALIKKGVVYSDGPDSCRVQCGLWPMDSELPADISTEQRALLESPEAFRLVLNQEGVEIAGRSRDGVLRGLATVGLLASWAKNRGRDQLPCMTILDAPAISKRGWMMQLTKEQIDMLFLLRYNTLIFGAVGYGKDAKFPFDSHPNIGSKNAPSKAELKELADYARARGINPVPMFCGWSRAGYIYNKPEYRHLAENQELLYGSRYKNHHDKNGCASNPETWKLLKDLFAEIVDTFEPTDVHMAMDEVFYDDVATCDRCQAAGVKPSDYLITAITNTHNFLKSRGVRTWVWGDCLDPGANGGYFDISGPEILAKLPKDLVIDDWKYRGSDYSSVKMFVDAGFPTVVSCWQTPWNVAGIIGSLYFYGGDGFVGTAWNDTRAVGIPAELVCNLSLGSYLSWSPQSCDLIRFPFVPGALYQILGYYYGQENKPAAKVVRFIDAASTNKVSGAGLINAMGLMPVDKLGFLDASAKSLRGVPFKVFRNGKHPAAIVVKGGQKSGVVIPLTGKADYLTFMHTTSKQAVAENMHTINKKFKGAVAGTYLLHYTDGTTASYLLRFRRDITAWNDRHAPSEALPALFGTVDDALHVNISQMTWSNPHPAKELVSIELLPGNRNGMDLLLFALSVE